MKYVTLKESFKRLNNRYKIDYDEDVQQPHICCAESDRLEHTD